MPRQLWLADVARQAGLTVYESAGWRTHGSTTFAPRGVVAHHTATPKSWTSKQLTRLLRDGHGSLPGPLAHYQLDRDGDVVVIAAGRANHAGAGGWKGLTGNGSVIGIEAANQGDGEPWPDVQLDAYDRLAAAVLARLGQPAEMLCAHREWAPNRKIDPRGIAMPAMRSRVARLLAGGMTPTEKEDDVRASLAAELEKLTDAEAALAVRELKALAGIKKGDGGPAQGTTLAWITRYIRRLRDLDGSPS